MANMTPDELKHFIEMYKQLNAELTKQRDLAFATQQIAEGIAKQSEIKLNNETMLNELKEHRNSLDKDGKRLLKQLESTQKGIVSEIDKEYKYRLKNQRLLNELNKNLRIGWKYLQDSDKVIKSTILNLGMSGAKADMMRSSFELSAQYVARLGGDLKDVQTIMEGFADTTGRARALSEETVKAITAIGRGTGLGVEQATRLAAQFEFMGKDAIATLEYVQGVVDASERMGVNTTKVLKGIADNFQRLSTFTFQAGVEGFATMARDAERTRVSMDTALNVAEATRGLEAVIELGANLQVMGGEFAKMDPLHWLYMVRNEPDKITEQLSRMTKGIYTLRRTSDGTFEKFISPADRDRLANVARSLGIAQEEMFQIAQRRLDLSLIERDMQRLGLSDRERELVEGAAKFDSETGKMFVRIGHQMHDITRLTREQARAFASEQSLLEERAKEALTFDEAFRATINELKASLLPLLHGVNSVLRIVRPIAETIGDAFNWLSRNWGTFGSILSGAGLLTAAIALKAGAMLLDRGISRMIGGIGRGGRGLMEATARTTAPKAIAETAQPTAVQSLARGKAARHAGKGAMMRGAGVGAAGLGIGAGVAAGAMGIAELAKAMKGMKPEEIDGLNRTLRNLAGVMIVLGVAGGFAMKAVPALWGIGVAAAGIGVGIGAAAYGMSFLAESLGNMGEKVNFGQLMGIAGGITAIAAATATMMNPLTVGGLAMLTGVMGAIHMGYTASAKSAESIERMGTAMKGTRDDFLAVERAVEAINSLDRRNSNIFSDLANIMKQPLKVEFANPNVAFRSDVTLQIDRTKFLTEIFDAELVTQLIERRRTNK